MTIPLSFVRGYLKLKGRKELEYLACDTCDMHHIGYPFQDNDPPFDHPIKFLYEHTSLGHKCWFTVCFYWFWTAGGGPVATIFKEGSPDVTEWVGCKTHICVWNPTTNKFVVESVTEDRNYT